MKLGVFLYDTKTRRAELSTDRLQQLADLGLEWGRGHALGRNRTAPGGEHRRTGQAGQERQWPDQGSRARAVVGTTLRPRRASRPVARVVARRGSPG